MSKVTASYAARRITAAEDRALRRFNWVTLREDFERLKDSEMLVFDSEKFGVSARSLAEYVNSALDRRKITNPNCALHTVRSRKDGSVIVAKRRDVKVKRSPYSR